MLALEDPEEVEFLLKFRAGKKKASDMAALK